MSILLPGHPILTSKLQDAEIHLILPSTVDKPSDATSFEQIYASLGQIVTFCLDSDISLAPRSQTGRPKAGPSDPAPKGRDSDEDPDDFTIWDQTQAKHIAYGIKQAFDVDFDSEVIVAEANVRKLASDVLEARKVLDPQFRPAFSMEQ